MKYKVIINFSIYNNYFIPPKKSSDPFDDFLYMDEEDKDNSLYNEFKINDILEVKQVIAYSDYKRYVIVKFNDKIYDIPVDIFMLCTEKI